MFGKNEHVCNMFFSYDVFTYDVYHELDHIGQFDPKDAFVKMAEKNKRLNMLIFVLSFDYLSTVIEDERKHLKFEITFLSFFRN